MTDVQMHLLLNHLPSIGQLAGFGAFIFGLISKNRTIRLTGSWIILVAALFVLPVNWSGEGAEKSVEKIAGINKQIIHDHEEAAETAFIFTLISGIAAALFIASCRWKKNLSFYSSILLMLASSMSLIFLVTASHKGGLIRHPEIENAYQSAFKNNNEVEDSEDND